MSHKQAWCCKSGWKVWSAGQDSAKAEEKRPQVIFFYEIWKTYCTYSDLHQFENEPIECESFDVHVQNLLMYISARFKVRAFLPESGISFWLPWLPWVPEAFHAQFPVSGKS